MNREPTAEEVAQVEGMIVTMQYCVNNRVMLDKKATKVLIMTGLLVVGGKRIDSEIFQEVIDSWEDVEIGLCDGMGYRPRTIHSLIDRANDIAKFLRTGDERKDHITQLEIALHIERNRPNRNLVNTNKIIYGELSDYLVKEMGY